jgi:hypothetical protein
MLRRVALLRTDLSEERRASIIRVTRIDELGTTLTVTSNRRKLRRNTIKYYEDETVRLMCRTPSTSQKHFLILISDRGRATLGPRADGRMG